MVDTYLMICTADRTCSPAVDVNRWHLAFPGCISPFLTVLRVRSERSRAPRAVYCLRCATCAEPRAHGCAAVRAGPLWPLPQQNVSERLATAWVAAHSELPLLPPLLLPLRTSPP